MVDVHVSFINRTKRFHSLTSHIDLKPFHLFLVKFRGLALILSRQSDEVYCNPPWVMVSQV